MDWISFFLGAFVVSIPFAVAVGKMLKYRRQRYFLSKNNPASQILRPDEDCNERI